MNPYINTLRTPLSGTAGPPPSSSNQWRCPHKRLHLDNQDCVPISPDSPIIDTPSKTRKLQARRNAALLVNSQATTQPTPTGPPARSRRNASKGSLASVADSPRDQGDNFAREESQVSEASRDFLLMPSSPPSQHAAERVSETPLADLPSSPPLPRLTAANLHQFNSQAAHKSAIGVGSRSSSDRSHADVPAASPPAPSVHSLPSEVAHQISRLVLRTRINALKHNASEVQLEATRAALETALARVQQEASRVDAWMATAFALLLLCLAYAAWCQWDSAEFALIEERRREWFGL